MARVSVEQQALSDARYEVLGRLFGFNRHEALGRMILVWNECQERGTYYLSGPILDGIFGSADSGEKLASAELARATETRGYYVRGSRGRVEWLKKRREDGKKGGRPKKTLGLSLGIDEKQRRENPPAPALTPALTPREESAVPSAAPSNPPSLPSPTRSVGDRTRTKPRSADGAYREQPGERPNLKPDDIDRIERYRIRRQELQTEMTAKYPDKPEHERMAFVSAQLRVEGLA